MNYKTRLTIFPILVVFLLSGCAASQQARIVHPSGFVDERVLMCPIEKDLGLLVYEAENVDFYKYKKVIIEPVVAWGRRDEFKSGFGKMAQKDIQFLANYLDSSVRREMRNSFTLSNTAASDTMRMRIAITQGKSSHVLTDTVTSVVVYGRVFSILKGWATGVPFAVGETSIEVEIIDSLTGDLLMALADKRVGKKRLPGMFDKWDDIRAAFDYWAASLAKNMADLRVKEYFKEEVRNVRMSTALMASSRYQSQ